LAALGLVALLPSFPLGGDVVAREGDDTQIFSLELIPHGPAAAQDATLDIALVAPGSDWPGPLAEYSPQRPLLLTHLPVPYDVLLRSRDGLWAARETLYTQEVNTPIAMTLEPRGVLSGVVLTSDDQPAARCLVTARDEHGRVHTELTAQDGSFQFSWLPESKYALHTPASIHGSCKAEAITIAGQEVRLHMQPRPSLGQPAEVIGQVQSKSGAYQEDLMVRLWPLDSAAAPSQSEVVWTANASQVISGSFAVPATLGEQYVLTVEKSDLLPAAYTHTPILAPSQDVAIYCDDSTPHTSLRIRPELPAPSTLSDFEVALSWGQGVVWRRTQRGECLIEGVPCGTPISWVVRAPDAPPIFGETTFTEGDADSLITPQLALGWGEGLKLIHPDGAPAAHVLVLLDGTPAGRTDQEGLLTIQATQRPEHLSLRTEHHRLFGGTNSTRRIDSLDDRDEFGRLLLVLLPRD